jgi:predicted DNA-binding transcriptional regulator YafY
MLETSARLLQLLSILQSKREWRGPELAEKLGVGGRTVRNDIGRLRELGYPVTATRGSAGGYQLGAGAQMPPLLLDDEEVVAVAVGLRTAATGSVAGIEEASLRALAKLEQVLPARLRRRLAALQNATVLVPDYHPPESVEHGVLSAIANACRDHEQLRFDYHKHSGTTSLRLVEPYRLVAWGPRWYLVGWDVDRQDWRTFRAERMQLRVPGGARFSPRELPGGDAAAWVAQHASAARWRHRARVLVHAPAEYVINRINPTVGTVEMIDEYTCILDTGSDSIRTFAVYLSMLGVDFCVTEPPELVEYVQQLAGRYRRATDC